MIKVTLIKSTAGEVKSVKDTVAALGLKKIRQSRTFEENPAILGQIRKVSYLLKIEQIEGEQK